MGKHSARHSKGLSGPRTSRRTARLDDARPVAPRSRKRGPLEESPELPVHRQRRKGLRKRVLAVIGLALVALLLAGGVWALAFMRSINNEFQDDVAKDDKLAEVLTEPEPAKPFTILLLGSDVRPDEEAARADTIIVAKVDPAEKRVWMISIPRDTRVDVPGYGTEKINAANFHGGPALAVETVEKFLDIPINHYMEIDFEGFQSIVDALGGVYIDVDVEIDDWKAASHSKHHKASHIEPGYQLLDGEYALTYVRSRNFPDSDFTRMRHQQTFFKALAKQSTRWDNLFKLPGAIREFAKATTTDMSVGEMFGVASALRGLEVDSVQTATLVGEWRTPYVWTDEELKERLVTALKEGGDIETAKEPDQASAIKPQDVTVTIRNGGGISGIAAQCSDTLKAAGFDVRGVGNANQFVYDETLVVYREGDAAANAAAAALPAAKVISSRGMYLFNTDILVVVGKDWPAAYAAAGKRAITQ